MLLGYLSCLVAGGAAAYAASERYFYFWDYAVYQDLTGHVSDGFRVSFAEGLERIRRSLSDDYNAFFTMPIVPIARMFGADRPVFLGCLALFYQVPFILMVAAVARQLFWGGPRRVFWLAALTAALVPALSAPMLRGYPDPGGATLFLVAVWMYLVALRRGGSLRLVAGTGFYLGAAMLFRRHYAYAAVAFFVTVVLYRSIPIARSPRDPLRGRRDLRGAIAEIAVLAAATTATLIVFGSAFLRYLMAANYYTLYESFLNPPLTNLTYFVHFFGGGVCVLAALGWVAAWRTRAARPGPARFCLLFGVVSCLLWVMVVRQVGTHLGLHLTLLVVPGLVGLVLAGGRLRGRTTRIAFLGSLAGFFIVNMIQSLSPWMPPPGWPVGTVFSDRYPALSRPDDKEVHRLVSYLRSVARPDDPIFVEGSSTTMNYDVLKHADRASQPFGPSLSIQTTPQVDSRDWYPIEGLLRARAVVVTLPPQFHLAPQEQDVVRLSHEVFTKSWEFAGDFSLAPERFELEHRVEARVFLRHRDTDLARSLRLMGEMRRWMGSRPLGPAPAWLALTPSAFWADGARTALRAVTGPGHGRQAILHTNPDWHGDRITLLAHFEGSRGPARVTASAVDLGSGDEHVLDSRILMQTAAGPMPVVLNTSAADTSRGWLLLSVEALDGAPLVVLSDIAVR